jgi:hypothetical protein
MSAFRDQLADAVAAVEVLSPTRYAWLGEPSEALPAHVERGLSAADARGYLTYGIEARLYSDFYCHGRAVVGAAREQVDTARGDPALVDALSASNTGSGCWEPGWALRGRDNGQLVVERAGLVLRARSEECRGLPEEEPPPDVPVEVELRYPKELLRVSPGFYMALCERPFDGSSGVVRLYWNLEADGAVAFVREATRLLNEAGFGSRLKVANDARLYDRCDAGVVYMARDEALRAGPLVRELHVAVAEQLGAGVPALTRRLAAGVGLAEDPGTGESYGMSRCHLIADGIVRAFEQGEVDPLEAVADRFAEAGIDPDMPYLVPGSTDDYRIEIDELAPSRGA